MAVFADFSSGNRSRSVLEQEFASGSTQGVGEGLTTDANFNRVWHVEFQLSPGGGW